MPGREAVHWCCACVQSPASFGTSRCCALAIGGALTFKVCVGGGGGPPRGGGTSRKEGRSPRLTWKVAPGSVRPSPEVDRLRGGRDTQ